MTVTAGCKQSLSKHKYLDINIIKGTVQSLEF